MNELLLVLEKIGFIILLMAAGMVARHFKLLKESSEEDLGKLFTNLFWPCLILFSIGTRLEASDIIANYLLPITAVLTALLGLGIGTVASTVARLQGDRRTIFVFHSMFNNFSFMVLPLAMAFLPVKGSGLLFISNIGFILLIQSIGILMLKGSQSLGATLRNLLSPGLLATVLAIILVMTGTQHAVPQLAWDLLDTLGTPTVPIALILAGARIYGLGFGALRFDRWNISLGFIRLIIVPALIFGLCWWLKWQLGVANEVIIIHMLVAVMPVSINSVSMTMAYKRSPDLAAQGVVFTHLFSIATISAWMVLVQKTLTGA